MVGLELCAVVGCWLGEGVGGGVGGGVAGKIGAGVAGKIIGAGVAGKIGAGVAGVTGGGVGWFSGFIVSCKGGGPYCCWHCDSLASAKAMKETRRLKERANFMVVTKEASIV